MFKSRNMLARYRRTESGSAAMELAILTGLLILPTLNVVDIAVYIYQQMQTHNAAEMAAESGFENCRTQYLPASSNCTATNSKYKITFSQAIDNGIRETTLANAVALNNVSEGYYCSTTSNTLEAVNSTSQTCSSASNPAEPNAVPGDYILITATSTYRPMFKGLTVTAFLPSTIRKTVWIRMN